MNCHSANCNCASICRVKFGVPLANTLVAGQLPEALVVRNIISVVIPVIAVFN